jgi:hypothetical protein
MPMNRIRKHIAAGAALLGLAGVSLAACTHDDSTLFIRNALYPQTVMAGMGCIYTADPTQTYLFHGKLDIDFQSAYNAVLLVGNQMVAQGDPTKPATETSRIVLKGAIVEIKDTAGNTLAKFSEAISGTVDPLSGNNPSFLPIGLELVDVGTVQKLLPTIAPTSGPRPEVEVDTFTRVFGNTLGGQYVESSEFEFPVNVCKGCLVYFSPMSSNPAFPQPNCLGSGTGGSTQTVSAPCNFEDLPMDCSLCAGSADPSIRADCSPNSNAAPLDAGAG